MDKYLQEVSDQALENPSLEPEMNLRPDYGEEIYHGSSRPEGKRRSHARLRHRTVAFAFVREGADVFSYLEEQEPDARDKVRAVKKPGKRVIPAPGDTRNESHCRNIVEEAVLDLAHTGHVSPSRGYLELVRLADRPTDAAGGSCASVRVLHFPGG